MGRAGGRKNLRSGTWPRWFGRKGILVPIEGRLMGNCRVKSSRVDAIYWINRERLRSECITGLTGDRITINLEYNTAINRWSMIASAESLTEYFDRDSLKGDPLMLVLARESPTAEIVERERGMAGGNIEIINLFVLRPVSKPVQLRVKMKGTVLSRNEPPPTSLEHPILMLVIDNERLTTASENNETENRAVYHDWSYQRAGSRGFSTRRYRWIVPLIRVGGTCFPC